MTGPTGDDRTPDDREPERRDGEAAESAASEPSDAVRAVRAVRAVAADAAAGDDTVGRHAAPADESVDEAIDSGTDVTPQLGGEGAEDPAAAGAVAPAPGPRGRPPGRFLRVVRWLTSANPFVISVLSIFSALVIGAILIVIGDRPVLREFGYFFAAARHRAVRRVGPDQARLREPVPGCDLQSDHARRRDLRQEQLGGGARPDQ